MKEATRRPKRQLLGVGLAGLALLTGAQAPLPIASGVRAARSASRHPNIVVIMTDDQTAASLRFMPNVRRLLMAEGTTFDEHVVSYPLCCPARATYLTGQYSHNHHVTYNDGLTGGYAALRGRTRVVPVALQRAGYTTVHIGKYLNGYGLLHPQAVPAGWDDWQGTVDPSTYRYYGFTLNQNGRLHRFGPDDYQTEVEARLGALAIHRESRRHRPFFLDLAFLAPHAVQRETSGLDPIDLMDQRAAGRARRRYGVRFPVPEARDEDAFATVPLPDLEAFDEADVSDKPLHISTRAAFPPREWVAVVRNYQLRLEALLSVDRAVARIVRALADTHHLDDTYLVFVSDNGFLHGEHRVPFGKFLPYEPSIRVPLVIRGPGVRRGVHRDALTTDVDLPATILDLAGARPPRVPDGRSLVPLLEQAHRRWARRDVLLESGANPVAAPVYTGLRTHRFKYVEYEDGERELYDLRRDPNELINLAGTRVVQKVERRLAARLAAVRSCVGRRCP